MTAGRSNTTRNLGHQKRKIL